MIFIILFLTFFFTSSPIYAQELFSYPGNPILKKDVSSAGYFQPTVISRDNKFSLWYTDSVNGRATIASMKSANGIDWFDKTKAEVSNRYHVSDPFMFVSNNEYHLYFSSSNNGPFSLWKSISADGVTYVPGQEIEVLKPEQSWERFSLSCPALIQDQSTYYLFYSGAGDTVWATGLATSPDGVTWKKCDNNPLISEGASAQVIKYNNIFYLFYHSSSGLRVQQTDFLNGCDTQWTNNHSVSSALKDPAPIVVGNDLWVYGSLETSNGVAIGLAGSTPMVQSIYPIILIPGMFASWNSETLLHNNSVTYNEWKLNTNITEYDAFVETLKNKGRTLNKDMFVFPYDWRKSAEETTHNLDLFIEDTIWSTNKYQPVQIVGHSLGGVISRIYADKNLLRPIKKVITVGSPHRGIVQAYKPLIAGEIEREDSLLWLAEKFILLLNKSDLQSDKEIVAHNLPILFDILPSFPYLKNESNEFVSSSIVNTLTSRYPIKSSPSIPQIYLGGIGSQTISGYVLGERTSIDNVSGLYQDGHPVSSWWEDGDGVVLKKSSLNQSSPEPTQNHGELIYSKEGIKAILSQLDMQIQDDDVANGKATAIFPAILSFIQSPASMQITHNGITIQENDGMIHLQNTQDGNYSLRVTGESDGEYTVSVWLIGESDDKWLQFKKPTAQGQIDEYTILFDESTGGAVIEYTSPIIVEAPTPTITPSAAIVQTQVVSVTSTSSTSSPASTSSSKQNKTQNTISESASKNTNFTNLISKTIDTIVNPPIKKNIIASKENSTQQILGISDKRNFVYRFPFLYIFFIKQIMWGLVAIFLLVLARVKSLTYQ